MKNIKEVEYTNLYTEMLRVILLESDISRQIHRLAIEVNEATGLKYRDCERIVCDTMLDPKNKNKCLAAMILSSTVRHYKEKKETSECGA